MNSEWPLESQGHGAKVKLHPATTNSDNLSKQTLGWTIKNQSLIKGFTIHPRLYCDKPDKTRGLQKSTYKSDQ